MSDPHAAGRRSLRSIESRSPAVTRAIGVLEELSRRGVPTRLADLARSLDLAKSTVANVCAALEDSHVVRRVDGLWALDYRVVEFGQSFLASTDIVAEFRRAAATLPTAHAETMLLAILDGTDVLYLARHDGTQPIRLASDIGRRMPAVVTALGKAMLAQLPPAQLEQRLAEVGELPVLTSRSHRSVESLKEDLEVTARRGYAMDDQQNTEGVSCFGVAVPGGPSRSIAVSATLLSARVTDQLREDIVADLTTLSRAVARVVKP
ncbi:IclR family transcriptional regulator [Lentzea sp. HUAS12]|uniref:IclR family transcriptional regulator n=1 Tax=Lentzea sp. HUAS12 TaxID=2951806 RepID=UPI00209E95D6|nr:IclR family transcriptional regulator [Lentzea sp. HUAS12]USX53988.1 IclR family transcriptional regulator [Lentzea sp. HUAS12]